MEQNNAGSAPRCDGIHELARVIPSQRFGISDVCRSVAEANMGGGFCIKAVTRYAVLYDVENILILRSETEQNIRNFIFHKHHPTTC